MVVSAFFCSIAMISDLNKTRLLLVSSLLLLVVFAGAAYALRVEPYWLKETRLRTESPRLGAGFPGLRIVFASDIHLGVMFREERLEGLTARINALKPDIIILGGDQISRAENIIERFYRNFSAQVNAPVYAVLGNHDYPDHGGGKSLREMAHCGIRSLDNAAYDLTVGGARLRIAGVGDFWMGTQDLRPAFERLDGDTFLLLISHNPEFGDYLGKYKKRVDLMLSGHLHGRQINPFGFPMALNPARIKGHYYGKVNLNKHAFAFISSGVGTSNLPMRFMARPEIVVIELAAPLR